MVYRHAHYFKIDSKLVQGHLHYIKGYTEYVIGTESFHFHLFIGISTYTDHTHGYSGITGLPVKSEKQGHYHKIQGVLESDGKHEHEFKGYTFEEISYSKGKETREAFI